MSFERLGLALLEDWIHMMWGPRMIQLDLNIWARRNSPLLKFDQELVEDWLWSRAAKTYLSLSKVSPRLNGQVEVASHVTIHKPRTAMLRTRYEKSLPSGCLPIWPALANVLGSPIKTMKMFTTSTTIPKITLDNGVAESVLGCLEERNATLTRKLAGRCAWNRCSFERTRPRLCK